jgi:ATP synthase protein I
MAEQQNPIGDDALKNLSARVARLAQEREAREPKQAIDRSGMSLGLRMASEFASAILVGGLLGYGFDFLLKTMPWGLLVGLGFGFAAGTVNLVRASRQMAQAHPVAPDARVFLDDDDDDE